MSSIYGRINLSGQPLPKNDLILMEAALDHWTPDLKNIIINENAGMGHLMLYNTLASKSEQLPLKNEQYLLTSDARIDNRDEICRLLNIQNDEQQYPDSYLILLLYKKHHSNCIKYMIGDFAFAIWDELKQELFCARDHLGVKPFFYSVSSNFFVFASEKKGLLGIPTIDKTIDTDYLYRYAIGSFTIPPDTTLYKQIRRLPAAHSITVSANTQSVSLSKYWEPDAEKKQPQASEQEYIEGLKHHFEQAVKCRLRSDYEIGAELSGGLDSSGIVGVAHNLIGDKLVTFSNTLATSATDPKLLKTSERKHIEEVTNYFNIKNKVFITEDIWDNRLEETDFLLQLNDGLEMWNPTWQLGMKKAALQKGVRTMLSGFPGDQMVTDRGNQKHLYYLESNQYFNYWKSTKNYNDLVERLMPFIPHNIAYAIHKARNLFLKNKGLEVATDLFKIPIKYKLNREDTEWHKKAFQTRYNSIAHYQKARLLKPMVQLRMEAETRQGIYYKTEPRFPMADIRLIEYYLSLPSHVKFMGTMNRYIYRKAVKDYLPEKIFKRTDKIGNMAPFLYNDAMSKEKIDAMKGILNRIKHKKNLPLTLKNAPNLKSSNINLLRWLELL